MFVQKVEIQTNGTVSAVGDPIKILELFDSGVTNSCISEEIVDKLQLIPSGMVNFSSASGPSKCYRYPIGIIFPLKLSHTTTINDPNVYTKFDETALVYEIANAIPIQDQGIDMLIGMDIIRMGNLYINNDYFSFEMPSSRLIVEKPITSQNSVGEQKTKQE